MSGSKAETLTHRGADGGLAGAYLGRLRKGMLLLAAMAGLAVVLAVWAIAVGSYDLTVPVILRSLLGLEEGPQQVVIWSIRLPRITAALVAGWALGVSGLGTQTLLRNQLASPFTLGISQGAAFGAAFAIVFLGVGVVHNSAQPGGSVARLFSQSLHGVTLCAFLGSIAATLVILALARLRRMTPESVILAGVALSSLFLSGTILVQFFATETELANVVFWTFGDVARSSWPELALLAAACLGGTVFFLARRWDLNALYSGQEDALGLGVNVERLRLFGMFVAALMAALATAFHGVIAFLGLLAPHIARKLVGADHRLLIPASGLGGAVLLLAADTMGRLLVGSGALPVGVLTSFMGAPLFLYLLLKGRSR